MNANTENKAAKILQRCVCAMRKSTSANRIWTQAAMQTYEFSKNAQKIHERRKNDVCTENKKKNPSIDINLLLQTLYFTFRYSILILVSISIRSISG